ncbi:chromosome partitioning protein [Azospirillum agricola]|uniref:nucleotide-binding protein n=1 Tax=Azospirillum agricola TaxID=1720247 RepID=UPI001AEACFED|nr:chromosome partitioning protein ParA [Azospirillum agricola]MBP2233106.1 chromosome partitioning protein [Azospirillum agricola]
MIITVGGMKGGSGKSLAATNLMVLRRAAGVDALLVDADDQETAKEFTDQREALGHGVLPLVQLTGKTVRDQVRQLAGKYTDVIIDTGGRDTASQRAALTVSNVVLLPFQPGNFDLWTLEKVEGIIEDVRAVNPELDAIAYISRGLAVGSDNEDAADLLRQSQVIRFAPVTLMGRKVFNTAAGKGLAVAELTSKSSSERKAIAQASAEMQQLYDLAFGSVTADSRQSDATVTP